MTLIFDRATQKAAIGTLRRLIDQGFAGVDVYQREIFVVDAPTQELRDYADVAIGVLNGSFHRDGAFNTPAGILQAQLPHWVMVELDLVGPDAPELIVPLASRRVSAFGDPGAAVGALAELSLHRMIDEVVQ